MGEEILASADDDLYDETVSIRLTDSRSSHLSTEAWPGNGEVVWDENEDDGNRDADETNRLIGDGGRSSTETGRDRYNRGRKDSGEAVDVPILEARSSSFEGSRSSHALLNNAAARHSRVNLHDLERSNGDGHVLLNGIEDDVHIDSSGENPTAKSGGLAAKAGIIIVSSMPQHARGLFVRSFRFKYATTDIAIVLRLNFRVFITYSLFSRNSYQRG